jgi:putative ABC transport system permease protein
MVSTLRQVGAIAMMNIRSIPLRFWMSISTVVAIALVVAVLLAFLAMGNGFRKVQSSAGSTDVAVLLRDGSKSELNSTVSREQAVLIEEAPGIAKANGRALVSAEMYVVVDAVRRANGLRTNLSLRGIGAAGVALRHGVRIAAGRMFRSGTNEILAGRGVLREFSGFELGQTLKLGRSSWTVVGVFESDGTVLESELWADAGVVQSAFNRLNYFQTVRARLTTPGQLAALKTYVAKDPRLKLEVQSEAEYFAEQASSTSDLIQKLGWPLAIIMALGALAGALNTMYSSVAARSAEIAPLRAIGFGAFATFAGTLCEALVLALLGGLIGAVAAAIFFNGYSTSTLGSNFTQVVFSFQLTPALCANAILLALAIGLIGGLFPAIRAARQPIAGMLGD